MATRTIPAIATAALAIVLAGAGCGDEDEPGPASIVPADAPAYAEVVVQPEGEAADDAEAALAKVTGSGDPGADLAALFERAAGGGAGDFDEDIEPWLGERLGIFPSSLAGDTDATLVIETTDAEAALEAIRDSEGGGGEREHEGSSYELTSEGDAFGLVDDFLVFGTEAGLRRVIDTDEGGEALGDSDSYEDSIEELPDDRLLTLFAIPRTFIKAIPKAEIDPRGRKAILQALDESAEEPVLGALTASGEAVTLELSAAGGEVETEESKLLEQLPGDSWLAIAFADVGGTVEDGLSQLRGAGVPGLNAETVRRELEAETGIDLEREVVAALGDAALFVQGTSEQSLGGALVIESKDADASAALIGKVEELIASEAGDEVEVEPLASTGGDQGFQVSPREDPTTSSLEESASEPAPALSQAITVIQRDDRIVAGYGGEAINQVLSAGAIEPLRRNRDFRDARDALGDLGVDVFASFAPIVRLAESAGAGEDPDFERVKPYLDALSFLAIGSGGASERAVVRFTVGLE